MGSLVDWRLRVVPLLNDQFNVLTYDLRGHGDTDMPLTGYMSSDMAEDLIALLDEREIDRAHLVGHSFGGTVALHLSALHPERIIAVTISDSRVRALQPTQKTKDWAYWPMFKAQLKQRGITLDEDAELDFTIFETLLSQYSTRLPPTDNKREHRWKTLLSSTTATADLRDPAGLTVELIHQISVPTQAIYGEFSSCLPTLEGLRENLPSLNSAVLSGLGHFFPMTKPALFAEKVKSFHRAVIDPKEQPIAPQTPSDPNSNEAT